MNTKVLMLGSSVVLAIAGLACSFLPGELLLYAGQETGALPRMAVQVLGALYFAFAMLNWMAKDGAFGGIYNRPIVVANLTHFAIGGVTIAKSVAAGDAPLWLLITAILYALFGILFMLVMFRNPVQA